MQIITGSTGDKHVTSADDGEFNRAIYGDALTILPIGNKLGATIVDNNTVRINDGDLVFYGRHARIRKGSTESLKITSGEAGKKRTDLIVARYELNSSTGYESMTLVVKKGTATTGTPADPAITSGNIANGATKAEAILYRVNIDGITIKSVTRVATLPSNTVMSRLASVETKASSADNKVTNQLGSLSIKAMTASEYSALATKDSNTIYLTY